MTECERAKFLASLGADVAKLCDLCSYSAASMVDEPYQTCFALEAVRSRAAFAQGVKKNPVIPSVDDLCAVRNAKTFTFEVRTTMRHYAIVSPTYMEASETVREETREPVLSVRKCSE